LGSEKCTPWPLRAQYSWLVIETVGHPWAYSYQHSIMKSLIWWAFAALIGSAALAAQGQSPAQTLADAINQPEMLG
jgi:hypothetical protein